LTWGDAGHTGYVMLRIRRLAAYRRCDSRSACGSFPRATARFAAAFRFAGSPVGSYFLLLGQGPRYFPESFVFIVIVSPPSAIFIRKVPL
jgi:hypothetical protein